MSGNGATTTNRGPFPPDTAPEADISLESMALTSVSSWADRVTGAGVVVDELVVVVLCVVVVVVVVVEVEVEEEDWG